MHGIRCPYCRSKDVAKNGFYRYKKINIRAEGRNGGKQPGFEILILMVAIMVALLIRRKK